MTIVVGRHAAEPYFISSDLDIFDFGKVHKWLCDDAYWSKGIPKDTCVRAFENSFSFGLFHSVSPQGHQQVGCARIVTDYATFGYLADVYIETKHRGLGLGDWLIDTLMSQESIKDLRRCMLATSNMHTLYKKVGFTDLKRPEIIMELVRSDIYER